MEILFTWWTICSSTWRRKRYLCGTGQVGLFVGHLKHLSSNVSLAIMSHTKLEGFRCPNNSRVFVGILVRVWFLQKVFGSLESFFWQWGAQSEFLAAGWFVIASALVTLVMYGKTTFRKKCRQELALWEFWVTIPTNPWVPGIIKAWFTCGLLALSVHWALTELFPVLRCL